MINAADLPDDIDALKVLILLSQAKIANQDGQLSTQDALIERKENRIKRLEKLLADFKRALFGAKSEKVNPEQYELALEDIETAMATIHAEDEAIDPPKSRPTPRKSNRGHLPKHLPRVEEVIEPNDKTCACGAQRHIIGEDTSERLDITPGKGQPGAGARNKLVVVVGANHHLDVGIYIPLDIPAKAGAIHTVRSQINRNPRAIGVEKQNIPPFTTVEEVGTGAAVNPIRLSITGYCVFLRGTNDIFEVFYGKGSIQRHTDVSIPLV